MLSIISKDDNPTLPNKQSIEHRDFSTPLDEGGTVRQRWEASIAHIFPAVQPITTRDRSPIKSNSGWVTLTLKPYTFFDRIIQSIWGSILHLWGYLMNWVKVCLSHSPCVRQAMHEGDSKTSLYFETKPFDWPMDKPESLEHKEKERRRRRGCREKQSRVMVWNISITMFIHFPSCYGQEVAVLMAFGDCLGMIGLFDSKWSEKTAFVLQLSPKESLTFSLNIGGKGCVKPPQATSAV